MEIIDLKTPGAVAEAARLAAAEHARLRALLPRLPGRDAAHYEPMLEWMVREGDLVGAAEGGRLVAFLGGFILENYRNAGPGTFSPDWCHGAVLGAEPAGADATAASATAARAASDGRATLAYRLLYRELASRWVAKGIRIHAAAAYASDGAAREAFSLTGFGRVVLDAAVGASELLAGLSGPGDATADSAPEAARAELAAPRGLAVRRAGPPDAAALAEMNARLAAHIGASPVLMPHPHGSTEEEWAAWFAAPEAVAFIAEREGRGVAFIKAEAPQFDVSDAVHGDKTLAINGMFTEDAERRQGTGSFLLRALAAEAVERGMDLVSVDCETTNLEAYAFWTRRFKPVTWSFERRV